VIFNKGVFKMLQKRVMVITSSERGAKVLEELQSLLVEGYVFDFPLDGNLMKKWKWGYFAKFLHAQYEIIPAHAVIIIDPDLEGKERREDVFQFLQSISDMEITTIIHSDVRAIRKRAARMKVRFFTSDEGDGLIDLVKAAMDVSHIRACTSVKVSLRMAQVLPEVTLKRAGLSLRGLLEEISASGMRFNGTRRSASYKRLRSLERCFARYLQVYRDLNYPELCNPDFGDAQLLYTVWKEEALPVLIDVASKIRCIATRVEPLIRS
jgi:hypothetical protein